MGYKVIVFGIYSFFPFNNYNHTLFPSLFLYVFFILWFVSLLAPYIIYIPFIYLENF